VLFRGFGGKKCRRGLIVRAVRLPNDSYGGVRVADPSWIPKIKEAFSWPASDRIWHLAGWDLAGIWLACGWRVAGVSKGVWRPGRVWRACVQGRGRVAGFEGQVLTGRGRYWRATRVLACLSGVVNPELQFQFQEKDKKTKKHRKIKGLKRKNKNQLGHVVTTLM
jgi:hypothetical protein